MNIVLTPAQKRTLLIVLASVLIAAILLFLFLPKNAGPFRAIPAQSALVLELDGLLRTQNKVGKTRDTLWQEALHSALFNQCFEDADQFIALFKQTPDLLRAMAQKKALVAFTLMPSDSLHALFILELDQAPDLTKILTNTKLKPEVFPHQFHQNQIFNVRLPGSNGFDIAVYDKFLLFSCRATLVEDALAQLENAGNWWTKRPYIHDLPQAALRVHLRPSALAEQMRGQMNPHWRGLPDLLARNLEWAGLSWDGKETNILAETSGFLSGYNTWGQVSGSEIFKVLPDNTALLAKAGISHVPDFFRLIGATRSSDFEQYILPWAGAEAAFAVTEPLSEAFSGDRLIFIAVRDSAKALSSLRDYAKERGTLPGSTGAYQMFEVLGFQDASLLKPLVGEDAAFRNPVCVLVDGFAVFAPDRSSMEVFLDKYLVNQTLAANTDFLQLQQKHPAQGNISFLLNTAYLPGLLQNLIESDGLGTFQTACFLELSLEPGFGKKAKVVPATQILSQPLPETDILWKTVFAAPVITPPYLIEPSEGKTLVLIQDLKFNLYCLDAQNGALQWSKALSERILSEIKGIDLFQTGTLAYTFSSARKIYTLDENGRDLPGFPFQLPAEASNAATVVDFEGNSKFSFFVACKNGKIYGFNYLGKPLDAWNGLPSGTAVTQPVLHFQHKGMDYLAVLTTDGLLSVFGRDGKLRFKPQQLGVEDTEGGFNTPMFVDVAAETTRIYCANSTGKIFACDLQGTVSAQQTGKAGSVAAFGDLSGNASYEWAVLTEKNLKIGSWENGRSKSAKNAQFPAKQSKLFVLPEHRIGLVDTQQRRIWMLDNQGKPLPGFPLGGNTTFALRRLNHVDMLVVGNANGVWAYRSGF